LSFDDDEVVEGCFDQVTAANFLEQTVALDPFRSRCSLRTLSELDKGIKEVADSVNCPDMDMGYRITEVSCRSGSCTMLQVSG
jgi:hypothetical protein